MNDVEKTNRNRPHHSVWHSFNCSHSPCICVPEPMWIRTLRTLWRWRPACYPCEITFKTRDEFETHWRAHHLEEMP